MQEGETVVELLLARSLLDLLTSVVHAGHDHPAGLDERVERLEVPAPRGAGRRFDVEVGADLVPGEYRFVPEGRVERAPGPMGRFGVRFVRPA